MKPGRKLRRALPVLLLLTGILSPLAAKASPLAVVLVTPTNNQVTVSPPNVTVKFNQCILAPPSSSVELRSPWGTLVSVAVSMPNCNTIQLGPTETLGSGEFTIFIYGITIGGSSTSMSTVFFVDNLPPAPPDPAITNPINDYNRTQVRVSGTGEPGSQVFVTIDDDNPSTPAIACGVSGSPPCPTVGSGGAFITGMFDVSSLDDSPRPGSGVLSTLSIKATVTLTDAAMNVSAPRYAYAFKDTVHPAAPVLDYPANNSTNANQRWTLSGQATNETGYRYLDVRMMDGPVVASTARAFCIAGSCAWHGSMLVGPFGQHSISAVAIDAAGNLSAASNVRTVTLSSDTATGPVRPSADWTPNPISPAVSVSGAAQANATVKVKIAGGPLQACAVSTASGPPNYSCGPFDTSLLPAGVTLVQAVDTTPSNGGTTNVEIMKDTEIPVVPTVEFSDPDPWVNASEASSIPLDGNAEPFAKVSGSVSSTGGGTQILFSVTADAFGNWKATTSAATLVDGVLSACVVSSDARGNTSASACTSSGPTLDQTAPPAPVIVTPAEASTVTSTTFNADGTAAGGAATIQIFEGAIQRSSGTAAAFTGPGIPVTLYVDGPKTIRARSIDQAGNIGPFSLDRHFVLDAKPPALASTTPPDGGVTNPSGIVSATYTDPNDSNLGSCTLEVRDKGGALAMGTLGISGLTCSLAAAANALSESGNPYTATVQVTDPSGNSSPPSSWTFNVDATAPPAPVWTSPLQNSIIGGPTGTMQGTAENGAQVQIFNGPTFLAATTASPNWSVNISFSDGTYTLTAVAVDVAGNVGPGANRTFKVDMTPPAAPVITSPSPGATVPDQTPVTGTAESGTTVQLFEGAQLLGQTIANPNFSITPNPPLGDGPHTVTAYAIDSVNNVSPGTSRSYIVDMTAPVVPVISTPAEGSYLNNPNVTVGGTAESGATVTVKEGTSTIGSTTATPSWALPAFTFTNGTHSITAKATDLAGNNTTSGARTFTVDTIAPAPPVIVSPGAGAPEPASFPVQGTGEKGASVELKEGATTLGTTTVGTNGLWQIQLSLPDGPHTMTARQTDLAGNVSGFSAPRTVNVDATPPGAPSIASPAASSINGATVTVSGTATEAGGLVTLFDFGDMVKSAPVSGAGTWSVSVTFADGNHSITAQQTDATGNLGLVSAARIFDTDGTKPYATINLTSPIPALTVATSTVVVTLATPTIAGSFYDTDGGAYNSGVAQVNVTILNALTGTLVQSGTATCSLPNPCTTGTWSITLSPLIPGVYRVRAAAQDRAGNIQNPPAEVLLVTLGG